MKNITYCISIFLLLILAGCKDNPVQPNTNITHKINSARPFKKITIYQHQQGVPGSYGSNTYNAISFDKAYAKNGFFIVVFTSTDRQYYNLSTAEDVEITSSNSGSKITLTY
jgi:hypothetical protein